MEKLILEDKALERKIVDNALNCLQKEHKSSSVKTEEVETLNEGLKYFKASPRLYKLALKIERKSARNKELGLGETVKKINALANKFEYVEDLYDVGKKAEARAQYKDLCKKYNDVLKLLRKDDIKQSLKKIGGLAFTVASMCVPYLLMSKFFPSLNLSAASNPEATFMNKTGLYLKRAGAFTLCGLPVRIGRNAFNLGTDAAQARSLNKVDKLLASTSVDYSGYNEDELRQLS